MSTRAGSMIEATADGSVVDEEPAALDPSLGAAVTV